MCFKLYESNAFWVEIKANLYKQCNRALIIWKKITHIQELIFQSAQMITKQQETLINDLTVKPTMKL